MYLVKIILLNNIYFHFREINTCDINPVHQLFAAGTAEVLVVFFDDFILTNKYIMSKKIGKCTPV